MSELQIYINFHGSNEISLSIFEQQLNDITDDIIDDTYIK